MTRACPPELADLIARAAVRKAAIRLVRALMREGGVRLRDLTGELDLPVARKSQRAARQLVTLKKAPDAPPKRRPVLSDPVERPLDRAIRVSGAASSERKTPPPIEPVKVAPRHLAADAGVVIPSHVEVEHCPGLNHDPRYQVDPTTFAGGEFSAEWARKRGRC